MDAQEAEDREAGEVQSGPGPTVPRAGNTIDGKYLVGTLLGEGGMGVVLSGEHMLLRQPIAIKVLAPKYAADASFRARFLREARAAASLSSEHAVRIIDVGTTAEKLPFMVMELLEGESLETRLERGPLSVSVVLDVVTQALSAVADAHARGLVHRDLKPGNLFLTPKPDGSFRVKVLDFGISKSMVEPDASASDVSLTAPRALLGSPLYMSPEQLRDASGVDARTDVWAMGVVIFELLSGRAPFETSSIPELYAKILNEPTPSLRALVPAVSPDLEAVVRRCLEKDRSRRFADAAELGRALERLRDVEKGATSAATIAAGSSPVGMTSTSKRRPLIGLTVLGLALASVSVAYVASRPRESRAPQENSVTPSASKNEPRAESLNGSPLALPSGSSSSQSPPKSSAPTKPDDRVPAPAAASARTATSSDPRVRGLKQIKLIE